MSSLTLPGALVSVDWLSQNLENESLVVLDASWHLPPSGRDGAKEWTQQHIPGARHFDFDQKICDQTSELPHMMPDEALFTREVQALGLNQDSCVVVYDSLGLFSAARAWWMLRSMGCQQSAVLDGGLPAWLQAGFPVHSEGQSRSPSTGDFKAVFNAEKFVDAAAVLASLKDKNHVVVDARARPRFLGEADEPRAGLRKGHMPGAQNLPFSELLDQGLMKSVEDLKPILSPFMSHKDQIVCSCGSGVTACIIALAAQTCGYESISVYDGSWSEWGMPGELPVVTS
ncbi:MAG: 3-mercaptopyruvate sulfurtransferase [Pseudomonadota bacterium]